MDFNGTLSENNKRRQMQKVKNPKEKRNKNSIIRERII